MGHEAGIYWTGARAKPLRQPFGKLDTAESRCVCGRDIAYPLSSVSVEDPGKTCGCGCGVGP